jgi:capsular polysaccharide biosynthesis protein
MTPTTIRQALWRERRLFVGSVLACLVVGAIASLFWPSTYHATATIYLDTSRNTSGFDIALQSSELLQHDFIVLATKPPVLLAACNAPGVRCSAEERARPDIELAKRVSVDPVTGTSLLGVTGTDRTAGAAVALANAVAEAMIAADRAEVVRLFAQTGNSITNQLGQLGAQIADVENAIKADSPGSGALAADQTTLTSLNSRYAAVLARQADLLDRENRLLGIATVIQRASPPVRPWAPDPPRYMLAALVVGVVLGGSGVLIRQRFDDRVFDAGALAEATGVPVTSVSGRTGTRIPYALAYAELVVAHKESRKVLVAASSPQDRTATVAAGLGNAAAEAGHRVLVLYSDGLSWDNQPWPERAGGAVLTRAIPAGGNADGVLAVLAKADGQFDVAFLSVPSPLSSPIPIWLARLVDQVVLVATEGTSQRADAHQSAELIRQAGGRITGSVLLFRDRDVTKAS